MAEARCEDVGESFTDDPVPGTRLEGAVELVDAVCDSNPSPAVTVESAQENELELMLVMVETLEAQGLVLVDPG